MLQDKNILLGVTGSIAAYKACDLIQRLKERGAHVRVAMTHSAARVVHPNAFAALTGAPVLTDAWEGVAQGAMPHIDAARWADLILVAPCTAHTLAELSLGLTGSPVSMTALAARRPLAVAPAMNTAMLEAAPVREHLDRLTARGVHVLPTLGGVLACGEIGEGKLTTPEEITTYVDLILEFETGKEGGSPSTAPLSGLLAGRRVLVSGGHTEEPLDGVRFLSNRSSGKTAVAMARAFRLCGARVHLVLGRADEDAPNGIAVTRATTSAEFRDALLREQSAADVLVMAAAIADFVPADGAGEGKWKGSRDRKTLDLAPAPNILSELGAAKRADQLLVGFALETADAVAHARAKMTERRCDLMVVNTPLSRPGAGFGAGTVEAAVLAPDDGDAAPPLRLMSKAALAAALARRVAQRLTIPGDAA